LRLLVAEATWSRGNMGSAANSDGGGAAQRAGRPKLTGLTGVRQIGQKWQRGGRPLGTNGSGVPRLRAVPRDSALGAETASCPEIPLLIQNLIDAGEVLGTGR